MNNIKTNKTCLIFLIGIICVITLEMAIADVLGVSNGPNYWKMGYPGNLNSKSRYEHPKKPNDYIFGAASDKQSNGYDGSHYGTHDWIADAALRTLRDVIKNPLFFSDWTWLINSDISRNKWPVWAKDYGISSGAHNIIRGYYTFLFATQMPDLKKQKHPDIQEIDIPEEDVIIKDFSFTGGMWVGQEAKHRYHFSVKESDSGILNFIPIHTAPATVALWLGKEAIKCINNEEEDEEGEKISAMQPEGAAGWLGAMTHYFADLVVPAHLIDTAMYPHVYASSYYHNWFENQLANLTKWDKAYKSRGGPEQGFFSWDTHEVTISPIEPIPPNVAIALLAEKLIRIAFRIDGNHQYIPINGSNHFISENSGLFLSSKKYDSSIFWDWNEDIKISGLLNSNHRFYYSKVEKLLCWSVYYTACAMQYCYNEGKKENDNKDPNPNFFVDNPVRLPPPENSTPPSTKPDPRDYIDEVTNRNLPINDSERETRNFRNITELMSTVALIGIPTTLREALRAIS